MTQDAWQVQFYQTAAGAQPAQRFIASLDGRELKDARALIERLRARGHELTMPHAKTLGGGLSELRGNRQVRIFYTLRPVRRAVLLDGILKKTDEIPDHVVDRVRGYLRDLLARGG